MVKIYFALFACTVVSLAGCTGGNEPEQGIEGAYCALVEDCNYGSFDVCFNSIQTNLEQSPSAECRAARLLLLDCLGRLTCTEYLTWSESHPEQNMFYPCREQDQLVDVACSIE